MRSSEPPGRSLSLGHFRMFPRRRRFKCFMLCLAALALVSFCGCETIRESTAQREWHQNEAYALKLIYAQRPELRRNSLALQKAYIRWGGADYLQRASYFYALVRFATDPDSRCRIIIVERRIPLTGSEPVVILRDGFARTYWHSFSQNGRERRHIILSPKHWEPNPQ